MADMLKYTVRHWGDFCSPSSSVYIRYFFSYMHWRIFQEQPSILNAPKSPHLCRDTGLFDLFQY
jgi:hypothetical protein